MGKFHVLEIATDRTNLYGFGRAIVTPDHATATMLNADGDRFRANLIQAFGFHGRANAVI
jgi:hypothetical protein